MLAQNVDTVIRFIPPVCLVALFNGDRLREVRPRLEVLGRTEPFSGTYTITAAVCLYVAHITALWAFWTDWLPTRIGHFILKRAHFVPDRGSEMSVDRAVTCSRRFIALHDNHPIRPQCLSAF